MCPVKQDAVVRHLGSSVATKIGARSCPPEVLGTAELKRGLLRPRKSRVSFPIRPKRGETVVVLIERLVCFVPERISPHVLPSTIFRILGDDHAWGATDCILRDRRHDSIRHRICGVLYRALISSRSCPSAYWPAQRRKGFRCRENPLSH